MIYLASPYTKQTPEERDYYFDKLCEITAALFANGLHVFAPILHSHPIAKNYGVPSEWDYWAEYDEKFLTICDELWVIKFPGWDTSHGVQAEIEIAQKLGLDITYLNPENLLKDYT